MKRLSFLLPFLIATAFAACKKDDNKNQQYSKWYVGVDSFSTSNVSTSIGKAVANLVCNQLRPNSFSLSFHEDHLPISGRYWLSCADHNPANVCFSITYNNAGYLPNGASQLLSATQANGKASYVLLPTYLKNELNPADSVLVSGVFNEP